MWLLQTDDNILGNLYFPIDSQVFTFVADEASIDIQEVYNVGQGTDRVVKQLGSWKKNGEWTVDPLPLFLETERFHGLQF